MSPAELEMHIRQAGFTPVQRDSNFRVIARREAYENPVNTMSELEAPPA